MRGTASAAAPSIVAFASAAVFPARASGHSRTSSSCTCRRRRASGISRASAALERHHRLLDEIRRRALERRVHRHPLGVRAHVVVAVVEAGDGPHAPEDRLGAARRPRLREDRVEARADPREPVEVGGDELLRLGARHSELGGERERTHAVEHAEVDRLRAAPLIRGDGLRLDAEDLRRRGAVDVLAAPEDSRAAPRRPTGARGGAARSGNSRPPRGRTPGARRRRGGSRGPPRCGSGCSAGSARSRRAAPSRRPPGRSACGCARRPRCRPGGRRRTCPSASRSRATRGRGPAPDPSTARPAPRARRSPSPRTSSWPSSSPPDNRASRTGSARAEAATRC